MTRVTSSIKMLNYLSTRRVVSLQELSDYLELSERSVQRLRRDLEDAGYQIETIKGPGGGYRLLDGFQLPSQELSLQQKRQIKQGLSILAKQHADSLGSSFIDAIAILNRQLDQQMVSSIPSFQTVKMNIDIELYQLNMERIDSAISTRNKLKIVYKKNYREIRDYTFEPYSMFLVNGMWYLNGYDQKNRFINLKISRIETVDILEAKYRYDENTNEIKGLSKFGYKINPISAIIVIDNMDYISEYIWGENQEIEWLSDHSFRLKVVFPNELAFRNFVLSGGSNMKVESPESEQKWLIEEAKNILKLYT